MVLVVVVTVVVVIVVEVEVGGFFATSGCRTRCSRQQVPVPELFRSFVRKTCAVQPTSEKKLHGEIRMLTCASCTALFPLKLIAISESGSKMLVSYTAMRG
jgi:hypothetical protein